MAMNNKHLPRLCIPNKCLADEYIDICIKMLKLSLSTIQYKSFNKITINEFDNATYDKTTFAISFLRMLQSNRFNRELLDIMFNGNEFLEMVDLQKFERHIINEFHRARKMFPNEESK